MTDKTLLFDDSFRIHHVELVGDGRAANVVGHYLNDNIGIAFRASFDVELEDGQRLKEAIEKGQQVFIEFAVFSHEPPLLT